MSAKNSGVTKEQYAAYDKEKGPQPRRVTLEVWRSEDKLPEAQTPDFIRDTVWVWVFGVVRDAVHPIACFLLKEDGKQYWYVPGNLPSKTAGTSWAYIPNITTEEAI